MTDNTLDLTVELAPRARFDLVDLRRHFADEHAALASFPRTLYWSCHTTAGFLEPGLASRLSAQGIPNYLEAFRALFPEGAGYEHDRLERREDLDSAQRAVEPRNADSHLAFIASGLRTCVTHSNRPDEPVFFVDLDGINGGQPRRRRARFVGFSQERVVGTARIEVPVSAHPIDSINLKDPRLGVYSQLADFVKRAGVAKGKLRVSLDTSERHSALTVNEYETLLMKYDLAEVLANPLPRSTATRWPTRGPCRQRRSATRSTTSCGCSIAASTLSACAARSSSASWPARWQCRRRAFSACGAR
jgi:thiamine phosphate synthase YjbQ (UPF0047 family)